MRSILIKATAVYMALACIGCSSAPKTPAYGGAYAEIMRNGTPQLELFPGPYDRVSHTCSSFPIYSLYGEYVRTEIKCH